MRLPDITPFAPLIMAIGGGLVGWTAHNLIVHKPHLMKDTQVALRLERSTNRATAAGQALGLRLREALDTQQATQAQTTRAISKEIGTYVSATQPLRCGPRAGSPSNVITPGTQDHGVGGGAGGARVPSDIANGFGLLHDYAARGVTPPASPPSGIDLEGPSGVGMPAVAATIVSNYGMCHAWRNEVIAWRGWYPQVQAWRDAAEKEMRK